MPVSGILPQGRRKTPLFAAEIEAPIGAKDSLSERFDDVVGVGDFSITYFTTTTYDATVNFYGNLRVNSYIQNPPSNCKLCKVVAGNVCR
jgi:hypothetical protein